MTEPNTVPAHLVVSVPGIRGGEPTIRGTRILAEEVQGYLSEGATWEEIRSLLYPSLPPREAHVESGEES